MSMLGDIRYALRVLGKNPGFTLVAVVTLALGIGANSAVFSVFDQVILRLLPVENPRELVLIDLEGPHAPGREISDNSRGVHSYPQYMDFQDRADVFSGIAARSFASMVVAIGGKGDRANGELVSGNFFDVLGLKPARGRLIAAEDDRTEGGHPVAVLSYAIWQERFGAREDIIGQDVALNGQSMTVIGVVSPGFRGLLSGRPADVYVPLSMRTLIRPQIDSRQGMPDRMVRTLNVIARLRPGVSAEQASAAMQVIWRGIQDDELDELGTLIFDREEFLSRKLTLTPALQGIHTLRDRIEEPLLSVTALVGLVLLIACVNVAGLLMARALARNRETAVRVALGASRRTLVRQALIESLVLGAMGGLAGLAVASLTMRLLETQVGNVEFNARVLTFNFCVAIVTALLFGLTPALKATRPDLALVLKDQSAGAGQGRQHARFRQAAVAVQVALSLLLLVAAGLFARTLYNLQTFDPGFRTESLLSFTVDPALNGYDLQRGRALAAELAGQLQQLPAVRDVGAAQIPVLGGGSMGGTVRIEGYQAAEGEDPGASRNTVTPGYFRTMAIPVILGREFEERDGEGAPKVAIVNEAFVESYLKGQNPLGRKIVFSEQDPFDTEIVGVVGNQKSASLREETRKFVYTPYAQHDGLPSLTFYLWCSRDEKSLGPDVRRVVRELDSHLPVLGMWTIEARRGEAVELERTVAQLATGFAAMATLLAAVGLYGLMAYGVARRTREIGVRVALGAQRGQVIRMVLREALRYLAVGLLVGIPVALLLGRFLESQLFGLNADDPLVFVSAAVVLAAAVVVSALIPARRAASVNPVVALRCE